MRAESGGRKSALFVITSSTFGGAQEYAFQVMKRLRSECHVALAVGERGEFDDLLTGAADEIIRVAGLGSAGLRGVASAAMKLHRVAQRFDAVHCSTTEASLAAALGVPRSKRLVWTAHGYNSSTRWASFGARQVAAPTRRYIGTRAETVVVASKDVFQKAASEGIPEAKLEVIYCGVDFERFPVDLRTKVTPGRIVAAGRFVPVKGFEDYVRAAAFLKDRGWSFELYGDGPLESELRSLNEQLGARVTFHPFSYSLATDVADACLFVIPSRMDGFPLLAGEILSLGLPLVITDGGGIVEVLDDPGRDGFIAHAADPNSLAATIHQAMHRADLNEVGAAGHRTAWRRYSWDAVASRYGELLLQGARHA